MRRFLRTRGDTIQIVLGLLVTLLATADMVGKPARAVGIVSIRAGMFGAGLGAGSAIARWRMACGERSDGD